MCALLGSIFPDLVDLGPELLGEATGLSIPSVDGKVFFWHRPEFSGSIYDGTRTLKSHVYHLMVVLASAGLVVWAQFNDRTDH